MNERRNHCQRLLTRERRRLAMEDAAVERARRKLLAVRARLEELRACHQQLMGLRREVTAARRRERVRSG